MKQLIKQVRDFISMKEKQSNLQESKNLLMELLVKDRELVDAIQLKADFDSLFLAFLAEKKIETESNLEKINWYNNNNNA